VTTGLTEFRNANPRASAREILRAGLRLNRDVAGMMVLTVLFAWFALRLPILILMHRAQEAFVGRWIERYAMEVIQFTSGSVALLLAGPFAAALFAFAHREGHLSTPKTRRAASSELWAMLVCSALAAACGGLWIVQTRRPPAESQVDLSCLKDAPSGGELRACAAERARAADWDGCMVFLWRARELDADDPMIRRDLDYAYMVRKWRELARETIHPALTALQDDARTRYLCGVLAWWDGDYETARQELRRALALDPSLTQAADALRQMPWAPHALFPFTPLRPLELSISTCV